MCYTQVGVFIAVMAVWPLGPGLNAVVLSEVQEVVDALDTELAEAAGGAGAGTGTGGAQIQRLFSEPLTMQLALQLAHTYNIRPSS